ncbi:DNA-binding transcriptional LysR family regulator [Neorhizobium galegae]|uniref:LysR family transcriptional regulator n=1 Tax=Neorhizobium galegae TaxID=399 RepID=UPI001AE4948E|nr:LysR family transcriptional regulator [Neorhizobium galegae]MBP2548319.1 DNA-binding transcriptional LysR family regulator [Neorhizobium galegae]
MRVLDNPLTAFNLKVLCTLLEERNVTQAANKLQLSQPATSLVLKQLREIFGDPLLLRGDGRMVPTERALMLRDAAIRALADLNELIVHPDDFDPQSLRQTFSLVLCGNLSPSLLARFVREVTRQAPGVKLLMRKVTDVNEVANLLVAGVADLAVGSWIDPPAHLNRALLFEEDFVCLVDRDHAFTRATPTFVDYANARHVVTQDCAETGAFGLEKRSLSLQVTRERTITATDELTSPYLLVGTDLVATVTRSVAVHYASMLPLAVIMCPVPFLHSHFYQIWDERCDYSPAQKWLRAQLAAACRSDTVA